MGYRDSDDSGFSRHGMNRDNDHHDPLQHQRSQRVGFDHPDLDRDEDLRTSHSIPGGSRTGRYEPYGGCRDNQGDQGPRSWEGQGDPGRDLGRDRYPGQASGYRSHDTGHGYGARSPGIGGYDPYEAEQRFRQQQYGGYGGGHGQDDRSRLNRPDTWAREGHGHDGSNSSSHGGPDRDQGASYASQRGRSYGYGYDGRPDARQEGYGGSYDRQQQGNPLYRGSREHHDPDYAAWRQEQLRLLDEDYDSWRNERYQKFSDEFNTWRTSRSRDEGLPGSNPPGQVTQGNPGNGKNQQAGSTGLTGTGSTAASTASTAASGKSSKDPS